MRMNKRAEGSFAETMMTMMIATVALVAFMGVFAYSLQGGSDETEISTEFIKGISIDDGRFVGIDGTYIESECTRMGYSSMVITLETAGDINHAYLRLGTASESDFTYVKGTFMSPCSDGSTVIVNYEVVAFA